MPDTKFHAFALERAKAVLDQFGTETADAARTNIDALRAELDARIGALQAALAKQDHKTRLERLVKELSDQAQKESDARLDAAQSEAARQADQARKDADAQLAAAHAEAKAQAEAAQSVNTALLTSIDEAREQLRTAKAAAEQAEKQLRAEFETRIASARADYAALEAKWNDAQRDATAARSERDAQAASLTHAHEQVRKLEQEQNRLRLTCEESGKLLDVQIRRASELAGALEASRGETGLARTDADARRHDLDLAHERIGELERERKLLDQNAGAHRRAPQEREDVIVPQLERVATALQSIQSATTANDVLEILIDQLGADFDRAAIFFAGPAGLKGWRGVGFADGVDMGAVVISKATDSPAIRAMVDRQAVDVERGEAPEIGVPRGRIARAVALPVVSGGRVIAVAYAEDGEDASKTFPGVGRKIAGILVDHASRRLAMRAAPAAQTAKGGARAAAAHDEGAPTSGGHKRAASAARAAV